MIINTKGRAFAHRRDLPEMSGDLNERVEARSTVGQLSTVTGEDE
jgi:hypothetical protein